MLSFDSNDERGLPRRAATNDVIADLKMELSDADDCIVSLKFGDLETNIRFVETHFHDLKVIIEGGEDE